MFSKFRIGRIVPTIFVVLSVFSNALFAQKATPKTSEVAEQPIPVSYGLVIDNSGSYRLLLEKVIQLVGDIVEENKAEDETFLVTFVDSTKIVLRQDFTLRKSDLHDATENMYIEGGLTAILDAVNFSARHLAENARSESGRARVLVLVTDGDERASASNLDDVIKTLKDANIKVFVVGIADGKLYTKIIDRLTKETGGTKYAPKTRAEISVAVRELAAAIRRK